MGTFRLCNGSISKTDSLKGTKLTLFILGFFRILFEGCHEVFTGNGKLK